MPRRVINRTYSVDDWTEAAIRLMATAQGTTQSEAIRRCVELASGVVGAIEDMTDEEADPHKFRRIAIIPDGYSTLPRGMREVRIHMPVAKRRVVGRTRLVAVDEDDQ